MYFSQIAKGEETQNAFPGGLTKNESFEGELALRYWVILGKFSSLFIIFLFIILQELGQPFSLHFVG